MRKILFTFIALLCATLCNAQIGYQVALLNTATGEPRANETITCEIKLTNSEGGVVYESTKKATSNDFGVVSLTVGDANTFSEMDWSKLPLYISVSVEGKLVGQTQVLTVPVAEHAKHYGTLTYENISEKEVVSLDAPKGEKPAIYWTYSFNGNIVSAIKREANSSGTITDTYTYEGIIHIGGDAIFGIVERNNYKYFIVGYYCHEDDKIYVMIDHGV